MATFSPLTVVPQSATLMPGRVCADRQVHSRSAPRTRVETDMRSPGLTTLTPRASGARTAKRVGRHEADSSADDLGTLRVPLPDRGPPRNFPSNGVSVAATVAKRQRDC